MRTARLLCTLGALGLGAIGAAVVSAPAQAAAAPDCRTSVSNVVDRPDSGITDTWALDTYTRTVQICVVPPVVPSVDTAPTSTYHAVVTDAGTFKTLAAHSPQAGTPLAANIPGTMSGGFTADFTAAANFTDYNDSLNGHTYTGPVGPGIPSTGSWVATLFDGGIVGSGLNNDWSWTYTTCTEHWVNANAGNSGDITGLPACPPAPALPVTGTDVGQYILIGGAAVVVGAVLMLFAGRFRRRTA